MRKSDGTYTYFVPDVAYHLNKFERGFGKVINVQGSTTTELWPESAPACRQPRAA